MYGRMDKPPNYRRRRVAVSIAGLALLALAQREEPTVGTLSIGFDGGRVTHIDTEPAPRLDAVAAAVAYAAEWLAR